MLLLQVCRRQASGPSLPADAAVRCGGASLRQMRNSRALARQGMPRVGAQVRSCVCPRWAVHAALLHAAHPVDVAASCLSFIGTFRPNGVTQLISLLSCVAQQGFQQLKGQRVAGSGSNQTKRKNLVAREIHRGQLSACSAKAKVVDRSGEPSTEQLLKQQHGS